MALDRHRFLTIEDLAHLPKPVWAIEGVFELNSLVMLAGPPASYKSFMALDWILSMVTGRPWNGRKTTPAKVLYILGEGKASLMKRIHAWMVFMNTTPEERAKIQENLRVTFEVPQMAIKASVDNMLSGLAEIQFEPTLIVIDTLARSFVGLDENSQKDTGLWVESAERLRAQGCTVLILHHTKKNVENGIQYRGSTVIMGAMDTAMTMTKSKGTATLTISKQKDHDEGEPMTFNRTLVKGEAGDEGSIILTPTVLVDERFREDREVTDGILEALIKDPSFESDRARAKVLSEQAQITLEAAVQRIYRRRKGEHA